MIDDIAKLTGLDEYLNHQIADTFALVRESDRGWTEKIWTTLIKKDGSLQVDFGLGKYINRNVMDGFAGVAKGKTQTTVRSSRQLSPSLDEMSVGPIRYEVIEPLKRVRFALDKNDQGVAFDIVFSALLPPFFEKRNLMRAEYRIVQDVVRYHQSGTLSGWIEIDGERHEVDESWIAVRDHSWGMRGELIGAKPTDVPPGSGVGQQALVLWGIWAMTDTDGSKFEISVYIHGNEHWSYKSAYFNYPDGRQVEAVKIEHDLQFDPNTRFLVGGTYTFYLDDGAVHVVTVTPVGDTAFFLRPAKYGGWKGEQHGIWQGELHISGERLEDTRAALPDLGQLCDRPVKVEMHSAVGYGVQESMLIGDWPSYGLTPESNYSVGM